MSISQNRAAYLCAQCPFSWQHGDTSCTASGPAGNRFQGVPSVLQWSRNRERCSSRSNTEGPGFDTNSAYDWPSRRMSTPLKKLRYERRNLYLMIEMSARSNRDSLSSSDFQHHLQLFAVFSREIRAPQRHQFPATCSSSLIRLMMVVSLLNNNAS